MKALYLLALVSVASVAYGDRVLRTAGQLALNNRLGVNHLLRKAELVQRVRRHASTLLGPRKPELCVKDCIETMDEKLEEGFPDEANMTITSRGGMTDAIMTADYDQAKFEKFCDIYTPSSRCMQLCPESNLKSFTEKSLAMVEFMCVDRYKDFIKYGSCMDKAGKEIDVICTPQCSVYEKGIEKLENLTNEDSYEEYDDLDVSDLLNQSCNYVNCLMKCDQPLMAEKCGQAAANLEQDTISVSFDSLNDLLKSLTDSDLWPDSCAKLAKNYNSDGKATTGNPTKEINIDLSVYSVSDGDDD